MRQLPLPELNKPCEYSRFCIWTCNVGTHLVSVQFCHSDCDVSLPINLVQGNCSHRLQPIESSRSRLQLDAAQFVRSGRAFVAVKLLRHQLAGSNKSELGLLTRISLSRFEVVEYKTVILSTKPTVSGSAYRGSNPWGAANKYAGFLIYPMSPLFCVATVSPNAEQEVVDPEFGRISRI